MNQLQEILIGLTVFAVTAAIGVLAMIKFYQNLTGGKKSLLKALGWLVLALAHLYTMINVFASAIGYPLATGIPLDVEPIYRNFAIGAGEWFANLADFVVNIFR